MSGKSSADKNAEDDQRSPIFLQFMDCVYQLFSQFPCAFQFNEKLLIFILDSMYSCHFGTFLFNCEKERKEYDLERTTVSLWSFVNDPKRVKEFLNPFYYPDIGVLDVSGDMEDLKVWRGYYLRYHRRRKGGRYLPEWKTAKLLNQNEELKKAVISLEKKLKELQSKK